MESICKVSVNLFENGGRLGRASQNVDVYCEAPQTGQFSTVFKSP